MSLTVVAIVPIESEVGFLPCDPRTDPDCGVFMRMMHLCYAAIGFAVARWIFKRQGMAVDPVKRFRSQGLL
jgi:hypothetical protein